MDSRTDFLRSLKRSKKVGFWISASEYQKIWWPMKWERAAPRMRKLARAEAWYCSCLTAWTSWRRTEERSFSEKLLMQEMAKQRTWVSWYWEPSSSRAQKGRSEEHT